MTTGLVRSLGMGRCLGWSAINSRGAAGSILVFWDKRVFELVGLEIREYSISCRFKYCEDGVVGVYWCVWPGLQ